MHRPSNLTGLLSGIGAASFLFANAPAAAQTPLTTELFVQGVSSPVDLTFAPGDPTRIFIVQQGGIIRVVENGALLTTPFLNIDPIVGSGGERGLLGLAFHPDYMTNGRFFVNYTNNSGNTRIDEFAVTMDLNIADPTVVANIATINQDFSNHNGGCLRFGHDGKLYVGMGDGGSANDPLGRAQNTGQRLGKMLRYDVDLPAPYIPADNPFVGVPGTLDEIWHIGLRNPWRFSFDRMTGDMYIGDVGQGSREEVDFAPAGMGGLNFGWRCKEGTACTGLSGCSCADPTLVEPIQEYTHALGCSITGGVVYRGGAIPDLSGTYFYADYCTSRIWSLEYDGTSVSNFQNRTTELAPAAGGSINSITAFGEDHDGEVYICSQSGRIWKIIEDVPPCGWTNYCQAQPNSAGTTATIGGSGSSSIADNNFLVAAGGVPAGSIGLFFYGPEQQSSPSGAGTLCVDRNATTRMTRMYPTQTPDFLGSVFRQVDFTDPLHSTGQGAIAAGQTVNFQFWYRDNVTGMPSWNFSNGLSVLFCP